MKLQHSLRILKISAISAVMAAILLAGCGKQNTSSGTPLAQAKEPAGSSSAAAVAQAALSAWQQGDKAGAVSNFLAVVWSARPLFVADSPLNLSENQFKALSVADQQARSNEMLKQIASLKQLAAAVAQAGRDAVAKGDTALAQKYIASLKQCGTALSGPDYTALLQLVGKAFNTMADTESAKIGK